MSGSVRLSINVLSDRSPSNLSVGVVISILNVVTSSSELVVSSSEVPRNGSETGSTYTGLSGHHNLRSSNRDDSVAVSSRGVGTTSGFVTGRDSSLNGRSFLIVVGVTHKSLHRDSARVVESISRKSSLISTVSPGLELLVSKVVVTVKGSNIKFVASDRASSVRSLPVEVDEARSSGVHGEEHSTWYLANINSS